MNTLQKVIGDNELTKMMLGVGEYYIEPMESLAPPSGASLRLVSFSFKSSDFS